MRLKVDIIVENNTTAAQAARKSTTTIPPVIFTTGANPVTRMKSATLCKRLAAFT